MSSNEFLFVNKQKLDMILPDLFEILHSNMSLIAPTNNSYEDDFKIWISNIAPAMQKEQRQIVIMYVDKNLAGYFQYYINLETNSLMMEDTQIKKEYQGTGLFSSFYKWLVKELPRDIETVEAYANKKNYKSQSVLEYLGLSKAGENKNGISFYYRGQYTAILNKYS